MKEGLSGSIVNEIEVNDRWSDMQKQARLNLQRLKNIEAKNPKHLKRNGIGIHTEGFKELAQKLMTARTKEKFKRNDV